VPNLIKVRPYDFFVGAGDLNEPQKDAAAVLNNLKNPSPTQSPPTQTHLDPVDETALINAEMQSEKDGDDTLVKEQLSQVESHQIEKQVNDRPMLAESRRRESMLPLQPVKRAPILTDDDIELHIVARVLQTVHETYYDLSDGQVVADSRHIMTRMRRKVLEGCVIVFSSVIPLGVDPTTHESWINACYSGARCSSNLDDTTTHLVAGMRGTAKINQAKRMPGIKVVRIEWLYDSIWQWKAMDEESYLIEPVAVDTALDPEDVKILSGKWEHKDDVLVKFGHEDWEDMNNEVDEAMGDSDSDSSFDGALDSALDGEFMGGEKREGDDAFENSEAKRQK